ncbi:hypothetical protein RM549_17610 [Salegentibacter sp. F188]|uniref:Uncharacterized protein n=1 Tax=Autumnicola patrickiae TaxID=3075591 RepID=A0ABU3E6J0_9FLAO|nr:hypothetical protein [Salegentibacter sp. F188]MDT0691613.1 hypothetical protein [Salegentibacter sp. F188]
MAEIKVEKKKPIWPWIIAALVILAILYFLFMDGNDDEVTDDYNEEQVVDTTYNETNTLEDNRDMPADTTGGVAGYLSHIGDKSRMGIDHEYTNNALIYLMNAVQAKANDLNVNIDADMQQIRQEAEAITRDPMATNHADKIKSAGNSLTNVIENLQQDEYPDLSQDVQEVRTAVEDIDPSVLTLEQKDEVNTFFDEAGDVLNKMS